MLPAGINIVSATLHLCLDDISTNKSTRTYGVHRVLQAWVEEDVTANEAAAGVRWETFFGTFDPIPTAMVALSQSTHAPNRFITWDVTTDVRAFLEDEVLNYGWLMKDRDEDSASRRSTTWVSKEATTSVCGGAPPASSPKLVIVTE